MSNEHLNSVNPNDIKYRRKKNAEEMKHQVITFALMIFLTLIAFVAVGYDGFSSWFIVPFILLLAGVQVAYQLYYFMHMSHKGHEMPAIFMFSGVFVAIITVIAFMTIIWW
ncbi:cytochrome c oxidase subunit IVB [Niallia endozanthoxylica]|uniref:Cytochrome c oxidase subunit IVB n=1 Tax=Niallia endozanthoxylica TaxID=2036016 RepID=A0A5J5HTU9_9BACI|nr:cytochrome c oxidase subunit IVB [Niallia endozanthoxylica]KAA9026000.1 cytochrome c oxidase subunit IVB [Niallia endozanthoxylica]